MKLWKRYGIRAAIIAVSLTLILYGAAPALSGFLGQSETQEQEQDLGAILVGRAGQWIQMIAPNGVAYAAVPDYIVDGTDDHIQAQLAVDALPSTGGKVIFFGGNYDFGATVTRAINNVTIEGSGKSTYFANNAATALFSAGAQTGWVFQDFRTDAGYLTLANDTRVIQVNNGSYQVTPTGTTTFIVASANATASEKAAANWICDGTLDFTEVNAAINALPSGGGKVQLTSGTFYGGTANISIASSNVWLQGQGQATILTTNDGTDTIDAMPSTNKDAIWITDLYITSPSIKTSGLGIHMKNCVNTGGVRNVNINNHATGIQFENCSNLIYENSNILNSHDTGMRVTTSTVLSAQHIVINASPAMAVAGLLVDGESSGLQFYHIDVLNAQNGVVVAPGAAVTMYSLAFDQVQADNCAGYGWYVSAGTGNVWGVRAVNCWSGTNGAAGVVLVDANINGFSWTGGEIFNNQNSGVLINAACKNWSITGGAEIFDNNQANGAGDYGVKVAAASTRWTISGNIIGNAFGTGHQKYGVVVGAVAADYYNITNNILIDNETGKYADSGTGVNKTISGNQ